MNENAKFKSPMFEVLGSQSLEFFPMALVVLGCTVRF
jgi:hypothetical protein